MWGGGGGGVRGLGLRNDVLTTCKAVTQPGGQCIIVCFSCISDLSLGTEIAGETETQPC